MSGQINNLPQLVMFRKELLELPVIKTPQGFNVRTFIPGEAPEWEKIIKASFNCECNFEKDIEANENFKPEAVCFVCDGNTPVATATAWYRGDFEPSVGYLHMVGLMPNYAGKGLGLIASLAALYKMREDGRKSAVLNTDDFRIPAIKTYLKLGFLPKFTHESHAKRWESILTQIGITL